MEPDFAGKEPVENALGFIHTSTPQLRTFIAEQRGLLPAADFAGMLEQIHRLFDKYTAALSAAPAGTERGRALHRMMDAAVATASGVAVSCRRGCYGCCHSEVEITRDDAAVLAERVNGGLEIDQARLALQAARPRLSPEWAKFWSQDNRCVFLNVAEGACGIYEDRPAACRRLIVTTPPEACTTAGADIAPVRILLAEILLSAALSLENGYFASLSKMLRPLLPASA